MLPRLFPSKSSWIRALKVLGVALLTLVFLPAGIFGVLFYCTMLAYWFETLDHRERQRELNAERARAEKERIQQARARDQYKRRQQLKRHRAQKQQKQQQAAMGLKPPVKAPKRQLHTTPTTLPGHTPVKAPKRKFHHIPPQPPAPKTQFFNEPQKSLEEKFQEFEAEQELEELKRQLDEIGGEP